MADLLDLQLLHASSWQLIFGGRIERRQRYRGLLITDRGGGEGSSATDGEVPRAEGEPDRWFYQSGIRDRGGLRKQGIRVVPVPVGWDLFSQAAGWQGTQAVATWRQKARTRKGITSSCLEQCTAAASTAQNRTRFTTRDVPCQRTHLLWGCRLLPTGTGVSRFSIPRFLKPP
ncbi:hypothetical protein T484DRAFT_1753043 [Baffinella frigidus]|jgi:hypothetical protein|nr:hypothetical protein T484DRAFT_1753043 [Cryptophyta sp. CCMP2293]